MKKSGYVFLRRRSEKNHQALAIARARLIPDAMARGKDMAAKGDGKKRLVQGKVRTKVIIAEEIKHQLQ